MDDVAIKERHEAWKTRQLIKCHNLEELYLIYNRWWYLEKADYDFVEVGLACTLDREILGDPVWLYLIAPSGGLKSELIRCLSTYKMAYTLDTLTSSTFISGLTHKNKETGELEPVGGLLKKMDGHCLLIKDFTTILKTREDTRNEIYGQLRSIYDGYFEKGFGTLPEPIRVKATIGLVVGVTPVIDKYTLMASTLGERFLKVRSNPHRRKATVAALANSGKERIMREELRIATSSFFESRNFDLEPEFTDEQIEDLIDMGMYVGIMRANVWKTWEGGRVVDMDIMGSEVPTRLTKQLKRLVKLLCIIRGKDKVTDAEMTTVARVARDTAEPKNQALVETHVILYGIHEKVHVGDLGAITSGVSKSTAKNRFDILEALGAVQYDEDDPGMYRFTPPFGKYMQSIFFKYKGKGKGEDETRIPLPFSTYKNKPKKGLLVLANEELMSEIFAYMYDHSEVREADMIFEIDVEIAELQNYLELLATQGMVKKKSPGVWTVLESSADYKETPTIPMDAIPVSENNPSPNKPKSLQNQLQVVLEVIAKMERISGSVKHEDLLENLLMDYDINKSEAVRFIAVLMKDGTIYMPRPGYYRRTA